MQPITTISIIRGTDKTFLLTFTNDTGSAIDLTHQTVLFTVKSADNIDETDITDANAIIKKTGVKDADPTTGKATIILSNTDTDVPNGNYLWDIRLVSDTGVVSNVSSSPFNITDPVTNRT